VILGRFFFEKRLAQRSRISCDGCIERDIDEHREHAFHTTKRSVPAMFAKNYFSAPTRKNKGKNYKNQRRDNDFQKICVFAPEADFGSILVNFWYHFRAQN